MAKITIEIFDYPECGVGVRFWVDGDSVETPAVKAAETILQMVSASAGQKFKPERVEKYDG